MKCKRPDCDMYPWYGLAPHHFNPETPFVTIFKEKKDWPSNFVQSESEPQMGLYKCPDCMSEEIKPQEPYDYDEMDYGF